jgi:FSR family fosmidomycin resistance protein-like MFS transporter
VAGLVLLFPASGAFVGLSQASLMDAAPETRERGMALWTLAGWGGVAAGPLLVALGVPWRAAFAASAVAALALVGRLARRLPTNEAGDGDVRGALRALRSREVVRWLIVVELQDLAGDAVLAFLALYLVDVAGADPQTAALGVLVWGLAGLAGNVVVLHALRRVDGVRWLRATAVGVALAFPAFQLVSGLGAKLALAAAIGALQAGWYPIAQARLYAALPGRSGAALGALAGAVGLHAAFWLVLVGPLAVLIGARRSRG